MPRDAVQQKAAQAAAGNEKWIEWAARVGFATKGVVYAIIGALAIAAAWSGGRAEGSTGAIREIGQQPFGEVLLWVVAVGLAGYALWRFVQATADPEHRYEETDAKSVARRVGYAVTGVIHVALAIYAAPFSIFGSGGGGSSEDGLVAEVLSWPGGSYLVTAAGLVIVGVALVQFYQAFTQSFMKHYRVHEMSEPERKTAKYSGVAGLAARGVTFLIIGIFVIIAGWTLDPNETKDLAEALGVLSDQAYGPWLLGLTGLGLICYAVFCGMQSFYRRLPAP